MPTDPLTGSRYPASTAAPNVPQDLQNAVYDLAVNTIPRFATVSARDSAYAAYTAAGGTLVNGRTCYTFDAGYFERVNGAWQSMHGLIGHGVASSTSAATSATTTPVTLPTGMRFSCYLQVGRAYEYTCEMRAWSTVAGDVAAIAARLTTGTPASTDSLVAGITASLESAAATHLYPLYARKVFQVAASGTYTFSLWGNRVSGTGTVTFLNTSEGNLTNQVKDIGIALSSIPFPA